MNFTFLPIDIDECASQPCQNNGTCIDLINDYQCNCTDGFRGTTCTYGKLGFFLVFIIMINIIVER